MARRSNSTPPGETETEGGVSVAEPLEVPPSQPAAEPSTPRLELLEAAPDENPRPGELAQALGDAQPEPSPAGARGAPAAGEQSPTYRRPDFKRWSANKTKKATRKELTERLKELEGIAETTPPAAAGSSASSSEGAPAISGAELVAIATASLAATFRVVSGIGARMRGDHWKLEEGEVAALSSAWAPVIAPHLGELVEYLPIVGAVAVTAEVLLPRIERDMALAKAAGAESIPATLEQHATE